MGGDGGTTSLERKYLRWKTKKQDKAKFNKNEANYYKLNTCALTGEPLRPPVYYFNIKKQIYACKLGYLYNKEAILTYIKEKKNIDDFNHIKRLSDIFEVHFIPNSSYKEKEEDFYTYDENNPSRFLCSVTKEELTGAVPYLFFYFVVLLLLNHVVV